MAAATLNVLAVAVGDTFSTDEDTNITTGNLITNDSSIGNETLTVSAVNGVTTDVGQALTLESGAILTVNANGTFIYNPNQKFDYLKAEESTTETFTYSLTSGTSTDIATVTLTIDGVNDAPTALDLPDSFIDENQPIGTVVGSFSSTDADLNDTFTYTLITGTGDTDNGLFAIVDDQLLSNAVFNYVTKSSYSILVQTADGAGATFSQAFTITVNDVPVIFTATPNLDNLVGTTGFDRFEVSVANLQNGDKFDGAGGNDTLVLKDGTASQIFTFNLASTTNQFTNAGFTGIVIKNFENIDASGITGTARLTGNSASNTLIGSTKNDVLNGSTGADLLIGGLGNDLYYIDNAGDSILENEAEGTDTVYSTTATYTLGSDIENLTLQGTVINGTGNELNNSITGNASNNILDGGDGNDRLNGGAGIDTLIGGLGNDTYTVDNVGDIVTEKSTLATEIDTVNSSVTYTLSTNVEKLTLTDRKSVV